VVEVVVRVGSVIKARAEAVDADETEVVWAREAIDIKGVSDVLDTRGHLASRVSHLARYDTMVMYE
jgi:hypothetical protein